METRKAAQGHSVLALAYSGRSKRRSFHEEDLPGPFFDATVFGLFVILGLVSLIL